MDSNLPPVSPTPISSNFTPNRLQLLVLGVVVLVVIVVITVIYFLTRPQTKPQTLVPSPAPATMTGLQIAEKTAQFLTKAQAEDGRFYLRYQCYLDKKDCFVTPVNTPSSQIMVALNNLSKTTGNPTYKQTADKAIEGYLKICQQEPKACPSNHNAFRVYFKETGDPRFKEALLKIAPDQLAQRTLFERLASSDVNKLASLYEATNDKKYLDLLVKTADQLMAGEADSHPENTTIYTNTGFPVRIHDLMALDFTFLPAYQITKDQKYLDYVKNYLQKANLANHIEDFSKSDNIPELIDGVDAMLQVGQTSEAQEIAQALLLNLWDNPENQKFNGDFGFLLYYNRPDSNLKSTVNSAWLATIFMQMPTQIFKVN